MPSASFTNPAAPPATAPVIAPLRQDATVIGLVGLAHSISHFSQLLLAPLFPWLKDAFQVGYAELGFLLTIFFVVSCVVQALSGFWVDKVGPRPVLFVGLALLGTAALGFAASTSYWMLAAFSVVAGCGNGVFHPVDYTLLNRRIGKARLGHAFSVHGITGSLGWALAPALLVPLTLAFSWRVALLCAAALAFAVLAVVFVRRADLWVEPLPVGAKATGAAAGTAADAASHAASGGAADAAAGGRAAGAMPARPTGVASSPAPSRALSPSPEGDLGFLRLPAVWMCFAFFFFYAGALSIVQSFAPESARQLHAVPAQLAAVCLSIYMVCSACGMLLGGFLAANPERCERIVGAAFGAAACVALVLGFYARLPALAVPALFGAMGLMTGIAGPSRDLLVKRAAPDNATGRVYGVVYAGLDIGSALTPLLIGTLMDRGAFGSVWLALALLQGVLIVSAFNVRRARRTALVAAPA